MPNHYTPLTRWGGRKDRGDQGSKGYNANISADTDLSMGMQGLQKGVRPEDVTSDKAAESTHTFSWSSLPNGGRSSFVVDELAISPMSLSAAKASISAPHIWGLTGGGGVRLPGSGITLGKRLLTGSVSLHTIPSFYIMNIFGKYGWRCRWNPCLDGWSQSSIS